MTQPSAINTPRWTRHSASLDYDGVRRVRVREILVARVCGLRVVVPVFFFFQVEDGIRDYKVTRVQTCALPISVTRLRTDTTVEGCGITLTLGRGNRLVCDAIEQLGRSLAGREIEEMMAEFGTVSRRLADDPALRWLGPHKGVVHLALASLVNACFDLWAKARGVPLWRLLLDLQPQQVLALLDLSYVEDVLNGEEALALLRDHLPTRALREGVLL